MNYFKLGDICEVEKGKIGITKAILGEYPLVTTAEERGSHNEFHFDKPSVIIPLVSSTGHGHASIKRIHYQEGKFAVGSILGVVTPKDPSQLDPQYLYSYLSANKDTVLVPLMKGAANVSLPIGRLKGLEVPVPDLETQKKIIKKRELISVKSTKLNNIFCKQAELVDNLKQQVFQDAVTGKLTIGWRYQNADIKSRHYLIEKILNSKKELNKRFQENKRNNIPFKIPDSWIWSDIGSIAKFISSGSRDWAKYYSKSGAKFLRMSNLSKNSLQLRVNDMKYVNPPRDGEGTRTLLQNGDYLVSITGEVGMLGRIPDDFGEAYINQHTGMIRLINEITNLYVGYYFLSPLAQKQFKTPQRGVKNSFRISDIQFMQIPIPSLEEQKEIVKKIEKMIKKIDQIEKNILNDMQNLESLEQTVMSEVFN